MPEILKNTLIALAVVGVSGVLFGYLLSLASKFFAVKIDERVQKIRSCLPGANCGGCGYAGCDAYAAAVNEGAPVNLCNAGGQPVADQIAEITGRAAGKVEEKKAFVYCSGGGSGKFRYEFFGMESCIPASRVDGGPHVCSFACVGLGSCVKVCRFHAISIKNGVAVVDHDVCTGCGACVAECPKGIIGLVPVSQNVAVPCRSHMKGADTMKSCDLGCIGCKKCEKTCEHGAITVTDALASIDYEKCVSCGKCLEVCPRHLIRSIFGSPFVREESPDELKKAHDDSAEKLKTVVTTRTVDENVVIPSALSAENVAKAAEKAPAPAEALAKGPVPAPEAQKEPSDAAPAPEPAPAERPVPVPEEAPAEAPAAPSAEVQDELDKVFREIAEGKTAEVKTARSPAEEPSAEPLPAEEPAPAPDSPKESE